MAATTKKKVHVQYDGSDSGSDGDSEGSVQENEIDEKDSSQKDEPEESSAGKKGLADVLAKILHKKVPNSQQVILAKGKTDDEILKRKLEREEEDTDNKIAKVEKTESAIARAERIKVWENMNRSKPDPLKRGQEKNLQKIATRGVVQLFNAVRKQQKLVEDEIQQIGKSDRKKDKVMEGMTKDKFLSILKGSSNTNVKQEPVDIKKPQESEDIDSEEEEEDNDGTDKKWGALREDYMMGAKMKDWGKENSDDEEEDDGTGPGDPDLSDSD